MVHIIHVQTFLSSTGSINSRKPVDVGGQNGGEAHSVEARIFSISCCLVPWLLVLES